MLTGIIQYAHKLLESTIKENDIVVDATCGNGNDTLFLSNLVGDNGHVYAFDIQEQAIQNTKNRLLEQNKENVTYIHDSHANLSTYINNDFKEKLGGAIFNLGYLPRSDKSIITQGDSTIAAINQLLTYIRKQGLIILVIYHGHEGGKDEKNAVLSYVEQLDQKQYSVIRYGFINQVNNPPFVVAIQKNKSLL